MGFQVENLPEAIRATYENAAAEPASVLRNALRDFPNTSFVAVPVDLANSLRPFFSANCYTCHSSQAKMAGLDLAP